MISSKSSRLTFVLFFALLAVLWCTIIRVDVTPAGDGSRILPWLSFVQNDPWVFKAWWPFRNGGLPLLADPEHFWYLVPFVNSSSSYANLQLNLAFYILLLIRFIPAWLVARRIGLSPIWAGIASLFISFNDLWIVSVQSGRISAIINTTTLLAVLAILLKGPLRIRDYLSLVFLVAISLSVSVQYAFIHILTVFSVLLFGQKLTNWILF